jgi:UDP-N-acetylglucosamine acyltransferase
MSLAVDVHATSFVDPQARIAPGVKIGPFCLVGPKVTLEEGVVLDSQVKLDGRTTLGRGVRVHAGAILGGPPQDIKYHPDMDSRLEIGDHSEVREMVTVHLGSGEGAVTRVGRKCMLMAYSHIGHNGQIGDEVTIANAAQLAGHVTLEDYVVIGGLVPIHQFCRIGRYSFVGGGCRVGKDVPPYLRAAGEPLRPSSLNLVGLTRHGFSRQTISALKQAFRLLYRMDLRTEEALERIRREVPQLPDVEHFVQFVSTSKRGVVR